MVEASALAGTPVRTVKCSNISQPSVPKVSDPFVVRVVSRCHAVPAEAFVLVAVDLGARYRA